MQLCKPYSKNSYIYMELLYKGGDKGKANWLIDT